MKRIPFEFDNYWNKIYYKEFTDSDNYEFKLKLNYLFENYKIDNKLNSLNNKTCCFDNKEFNYRWRYNLENYLKTYNIDWYMYICYLNDLVEPPRCPICKNNYLDLDHNSGYINFKLTCSNSCGATLRALKLSSECKLPMQIRSLNGTHPWNSNNRPKDENGLDIYAIKSNKTRIKNGNHPWQSKNLELDENGKSVSRIKRGETCLKLYGNRSPSIGYIGDQEHDKLIHDRAVKHAREVNDNSIRAGLSGWHSYAEDLLGDILYRLNFYPIREWWTKNREYRLDYYLPLYNLGIECDGDFKWNNDQLDDYYIIRKQYIKNTYGIDIINLKESNIKNLYNFNINLLGNIIVSNIKSLVKF